ncbi:hypothetical protein Bhyg_17582, partial [Pseudolycoriella hygida]
MRVQLVTQIYCCVAPACLSNSKEVKTEPPELSTQSESTLNKENVLNESTDSTNISTSTPIRPHKKRQSVRKYQPNWLQTFSWIKYEEASDKVFC